MEVSISPRRPWRRTPPPSSSTVRDIGITNYRGVLGGALTDYFNWWTYDINGPAIANTTYSTSALTDYGIDFIRQQKATSSTQPWFLYRAFNAPLAANGGNNPYQVPPANLHHIDLSSVGNPAPGVYQTNIPVYQSDIQALDTEIGRLLAEVDFSKTLVIFIGDNGVPPPVKDTATGLRDAKGSAYEGGVRVPVIFAGAGVTRRGQTTNSLFVTADLYATILDVAGVGGVSHVNDSWSLKPLFTDETASTGRTFSFSEISNGTSQRQYGLRDTRFKLVNNLGNWELYDLVTDPHETTNLYQNAQYAAVRAAFQADIAVLKAGAKPWLLPVGRCLSSAARRGARAPSRAWAFEAPERNSTAGAWVVRSPSRSRHPRPIGCLSVEAARSLATSRRAQVRGRRARRRRKRRSA